MRPEAATKSCTYAGCQQLAYCKELCRTCYHRLYSQKKRDEKATDPKFKCAVDYCNFRKYGKGYCTNHYMKLKANRKAADGRSCSIPECPYGHYGRGYCFRHYRSSVKANQTTGARFSQSRLRANRKKVGWYLSLTEYENLLSSSCFYCSGELSKTGVGLDRIDNRLGYSVPNVVPCCGDCNYLRGIRLSKVETLEVVKLLKTLRNKDNIWK